jgi:hypothetical protein
MGLILGPVLATSYESALDLARPGAVGVLILFCWYAIGRLADRTSTAWLGPPLLAVCSGSAVVLALSGSLVLGQLAGGLAAVLGVVWLGSLRDKGMHLGRCGVPILATVLSALILFGHTYASLPAVSAILLALSPAAAWVGRIGRVRRLPGWASALIAMATVLVPLGAAVGFAIASAPRAEY